jgi:hypothetical protein
MEEKRYTPEEIAQWASIPLNRRFARAIRETIIRNIQKTEKSKVKDKKNK